MTSLISGRSIQGEHPNWDPLLALVGEEVTGWFMWMFEVELEDGRRRHAYKHQMTRRYVHLAEKGEAIEYVGDELYSPVDADWAGPVACGEYPGPHE